MSTLGRRKTWSLPNRSPTTCLTDPFNGAGYSAAAMCRIQYYDYRNNVDRWSNELRLQSKEGGWVHWLVGAYWEKTRELYHRLLPYAGTADLRPGLAG